MDFTAFDTRKLDEYTERAKKQWGNSPEYKEYAEKSKHWTKESEKVMMQDFIQIFAEFGEMKRMDPSSETVQNQVTKLQDYITAHFYTCSDEILHSLGQMYAAGGEFTENIDKVGGEGTAVFAAKAIDLKTKH